MGNHLTILPGTPDDGNREYLPEKIKTTDIVVNENGNNSIVYPKRLREFTDTVLDGVEDIAVCRLGASDIVRHGLVRRIIKAYDEQRGGAADKPDSPGRE